LARPGNDRLAPASGVSCGLSSLQAGEELALGALHGQRGFGVGLQLGETSSSAKLTPGRRKRSQRDSSRNRSKGVAQRW